MRVVSHSFFVKSGMARGLFPFVFAGSLLVLFAGCATSPETVTAPDKETRGKKVTGGSTATTPATSSMDSPSPESVEDSLRLVKVSNRNGSVTPVLMIRQEDGRWKGPRGEYYASLPTPEELEKVYGF